MMLCWPIPLQTTPPLITGMMIIEVLIMMSAFPFQIPWQMLLMNLFEKWVYEFVSCVGNREENCDRLFSGLDDIYCVFLGGLDNLSKVNKQYGLSKGTNEAMFITEAYRTLRDRGPYPADQVLVELEGSFGFVIYDNKHGTVFVASVSSLFPSSLHSRTCMLDLEKECMI